MRFLLAHFPRYRPNTRDEPVVSGWYSSPPVVHGLGKKMHVADYAKTSGFPDRVTRVTWSVLHADPAPEACGQHGNYGSALSAHPGEPQGRSNNGSGAQPML
jgi:hypothetical protein